MEKRSPDGGRFFVRSKDGVMSNPSHALQSIPHIKSGSHTIHCCPHPQPLSHGRGEPESGRGQDGFVNRIWYHPQPLSTSKKPSPCRLPCIHICGKTWRPCIRSPLAPLKKGGSCGEVPSLCSWHQTGGSYQSPPF